MSKKASSTRKDYAFIALPMASLLACGFLYGIYANDPQIRIITKPAVLITYMIYMLCSSDFSLKGVKYIFIGHIFSVFGDIFLEINPEDLFLFGLGSFLIGHVWYVLGYMKSCDKIEIGSLFKHWLVGLIWSLAIFFSCFDALGEFTIPVFIYGLALSFLWMFGSYLSSFRHNLGFLFRISPFLGSFFFSFSDSVIALNKFKPHIFKGPPIMYTIIITYWIAQLFITLTAIKHHHSASTIVGHKKTQKKVQ